MPTAKHGQFHWNELMTWSVDKAKAFYADTLGWSYEPFPMADGGNYIAGFAKLEDRLVIVLDINELLSIERLSQQR